MSNTKLSQLPQDASPLSTDFLIGINGTPQDSKFAISDIATLIGTLVGQFSPYTPTLGGVTSLGTGGSTTGLYVQIGKLVFVDARFILGTSPSLSGTLTFSLPVTADTTLDNSNETTMGLNQAWFAHAGSDMYPGVVMYSTSTVVSFRYTRYNATPVANEAPSATNITATAPFTWVAGDWLHWAMLYKAD